MKQVTILFIPTILIVIVMTLSGCASNRVNLLDESKVFIEYVPSKWIDFNRVHAGQAENEFIITGRLKHRNISLYRAGHVDVAIVSPEGKVLECASTSYTPRNISRRRICKHRGSYFEVRLPIVLREGSKVRLAHHQTMKSIGKQYDCKENAGLPDA